MPASSDIPTLRLRSQLLDPTGGAPLDAADALAHLGAAQAQDYPGALWSVALRSRTDTTIADVERALAERRIVRTWAMRGTLHFVRPADVRWMIALLGERILARAARRHAQLGLTEEHFEGACAIFTDALSGGRIASRARLMALLEASGIDPTGQRGYHILWALALRGVLCCGPVDGTQQTFVLLGDWVAPDDQPPPERAEALALLANRYFTARGPATLADFAWWAGITMRDARLGFEAIAGMLTRREADGQEYWQAVVTAPAESAPSTTPRVHILPGFDEYLIGYKDRSVQLGEYEATYGATVASNGMFTPTIVIDGLVVGTWRRTVRSDHVDIAVRPFRGLTATEQRGLASTAERYGRFLGLEARLVE